MSLNIFKTAVTLAAEFLASSRFLPSSRFVQDVENDDLSPALDWITVRTKEALAANQKVILLFGEEHSTVSHVRLAELARGALETAGITDITIAREQVHNLSEYFLTHYFSKYFPDMEGQEQEVFQTQAIEALRALKKEDPARYHKINALFHAAGDWSYTPVTKHENFSNWLEKNIPVRLIDIAKTDGYRERYIDSSEPETKAFLVQTPLVLENIIETGTISITRPKGMHLRNLFMAAQIQEILKEKEGPAVLLVQTGLAHLGGREKDGKLYENTLHALLHSAENKEQNIKILSIFPEIERSLTYNKLLSTTAQAAMNNPDTLVLRGLKDVGLWLSSSEEVQALHSLYNASGKVGTTPQLNGKEDYFASLEEIKEQVRQEVRQLVGERQNPPQKTPQAQPLAVF